MRISRNIENIINAAIFYISVVATSITVRLILNYSGTIDAAGNTSCVIIIMLVLVAFILITGFVFNAEAVTNIVVKGIHRSIFYTPIAKQITPTHTDNSMHIKISKYTEASIMIPKIIQYVIIIYTPYYTLITMIVSDYNARWSTTLLFMYLLIIAALDTYKIKYLMVANYLDLCRSNIKFEGPCTIEV